MPERLEQIRRQTHYLAFGLLLLLPVPLLAADSSPDLRPRIEAAAKETSLDDPALKPWHLKLSFDIPDPAGHPPEQGTIEVWWAGPEANRTVYTSPTFTATEVRNKDGYFLLGPPGLEPYLMATVLQEVVHPMPSAATLEKAQLVLAPGKSKQTLMDCISIEERAVNSATYCLASGSTRLVANRQHGVQTVLHRKTGSFQGKTVATDILLNLGDKPVITAKVVTLETLDVNSIDLATPEGAIRTGAAAPSEIANSSNAKLQVVTGTVVSQAKPSYPLSARASHESGSVIMRALIGRDGHVKDAQLIYSPYKDLADEALRTVRKWIYRPSLFGTEPTEVETIITMNFATS